ncbi:Rtf2 RING-finger [Fragilaria crotonensis]|nr:Rtf2 RING-finger [Fragilaria crotonensis]
MIQGGKGDPDDSLWGGPFNDEFDDRLKHDDEGILSMANSGPRTNKRQFFLTFAPAPHLDRKHSIFGRVIQGKNVLREMKKVPTGKKDRPVHDITITGITVLVNPAKKQKSWSAREIEKLISQQASHVQSRDASALGKTLAKPSQKRCPLPAHCVKVVPQPLASICHNDSHRLLQLLVPKSKVLWKRPAGCHRRPEEYFR